MISKRLLPSELDRRFIKVRQCLAADGDIVGEHGLLEDGELLTESIIMPFHLSAEQVFEYVNRKQAQ